MATLTIILIVAKLCFCFSAATDTITQFQSLLNNMTLVSKDGTFELGLFSPGSSTNSYIGIWYKSVPLKTVVWVANGNYPTKDNSSKLSISREGNLVLLSQNNTIIWSTNATTKVVNVVAQLLDTGNFVLRDEKDNNPQNYLWQSFDYPSDSLLPGMKLGWDFKTGRNRRLIAWKNWDDPSPGDFIWGLVPTNNPESVMWNGTKVFYRSGPFDGIQFSGNPSLDYNALVNYTYVANNDELCFSYTINDKSLISRIVINQSSHVRQRVTWSNNTGTWRVSSTLPIDYCDHYNLCGPFGICYVGDSPLCKCLNGFKPKSQQNWIEMDWSQGCVHNETWVCREKNKDGFVKFSNVKTPDTTRSWVNKSMTLEECKEKCLENCSCTAYANSDIRGQGSGCAIWFGDLLDIRQISDAGQDLYVRTAVSEIDSSMRKAVLIASTVSSFVVMLIISTFIYWRNKGKIKVTKKKNDENKEDFELPLLDLTSIEHATDHFSDSNKLGEGGFGPVYRGILQDGQEIAVKRLSQTSGQGLKEFKNEVILCAKLQHRNLVKVVGCCIQEDEKLLIYEFMANKSLDFFLFDSSQSKLLDWSKRLNIINGIARGMLYLHQDSRLRIIHRDLKASNILLDNELNPKISDFGLARMCGGDQIEGNTTRVIGTYGYMAPEYAFDGIFSLKSDVFSFGVLLLEIVSGKKNGRFFYPNQYTNLIGHAWSLWKEGIPTQLIDANLQDSYNLSEALRCIHIALLCVQHHPNDRPNMASVVVLLSNENILPPPKDPTYLIDEFSIGWKSCSTTQMAFSISESLPQP
ncbi:G-type lectin S-receptor-like serine/threonine-protein kinase At4g27290 [Abrus precatorius]|uniref:Receptor-like serine/threonine-protein kinase n=1 Tax=Abrus precatorius TaxID=3816 RepID=A0A8B8LKA5_ABRPR|nr:G-type lectin S-receptor-like serine/threonine-protein kinase At4g27290 [Abrus precatorius]